MSARRRRAALLLGLALLAGCATAPPERERQLAEIRRFADDIARVYDVPAIPVLVGPSVSNEGGHYTRGLFTVSDTLLSSAYRDKVVAHEMAHYILGHEYGTFRIEEQHQRELDANALAVEIFVRVKGWPEEQAIRVVYGQIIAVHRAVLRGQPVTRGHLPPCREAADLLGRFPRQAAWTGLLECAPPAIVAGAVAPALVKTYLPPVPMDGAPPPLIYAYITDARPARGVTLGPAATGGLPRAREEFYVDGDRSLLLLMILKNGGQKMRLRSRWIAPDGTEQRVVQQNIDQTGWPGPWGWASHGEAVSDLWLSPGRWTVHLTVDEVAIPELSFTLRPGAGQ